MRYDDYENESNFQKIKKKKKSGYGKGHQSRHSCKFDKYADFYEADDFSAPPFNFPSIQPPITPKVPTTSPSAQQINPVKKEHVFSEHTHEIKGVKIDFDGVIDIQKVENRLPNNVLTYGIKFLFKGNKGLFRIIWYNTNLRARDTAYNVEYGYWLSLRK